ncbi:MAG TPA: hypothetical protein VHD56_17365, partial [Tepidisphaeraceae bacterium]|nr:hypothetical protein [Tepidisphaeraceae bacterium]
MTCPIPSLNIPLLSPPKVRRIAIYTHGAIPIESWKNLGFWCMHAYRYSARLRLDDTWFELRPGLVSVFPPQCELEYRYRGPSLHTYAHFYLENQRRGETQMVPALIDLGSRFEKFAAQFDQAVAWLPTQPVRSQARLWDLLWQLTSYPSGTDTRQSGHYLLDRALEWIELRLGEPFSVGELAD